MTTWELQSAVHKAVKENLHAGMTEKELAGVITEVCPDWQGDLISGERTSDVEGSPTDRVIRCGDVVLLDLQICAENKWSDLTRVYFVGGISDEQRTAYKQVTDALKAGEVNLYPGKKAKDLWELVRKATGSEYAFTHHAGHRIGEFPTEEIVAEPRFVPECEETLKPGMVVTLEPAVYYPGKFGIRLENNYLITEKGYERLCNLSLDEMEYIVKG